MQPNLILADEPAGSLDCATARHVASMFFEAIPGHALIITYNPELAQCCDRLLELREGALCNTMERGPLADGLG